MSPRPTAALVRDLTRPLRGLSTLAWLVLGLGLAALTLGGLAWLARIGVFSAPYWVFVAWGLALAGLAAIVVMGRRATSRFTQQWTAGRLEEMGEWRSGAIGALLDEPAPGTSASLFFAADRTVAAELGHRGLKVLSPVSRRLKNRLAQGTLFGALGLAVFLTAGPVHGSASALWHPGRALEEMLAPVAIRAESSSVDRGDSVRLLLRASGRKVATLWLRGPGEGWQPHPVKLDSTGTGEEFVGPLRTDLFARLTSGGRSSDTILVNVRIPAFLGTLTVTAHYPRYLGLEDEPMPVAGDTLLLPAGTSLETSGTATAGLRSGSWASARASADLEIDGARFSGRFTPVVSGEYRLILFTADGGALAGDSVRLPIRIVPDSAPRAEIPVPGTDTMAPLSLRLPLVIEVQDDHAVTTVELESRRVSRLGFTDPAKREIVPLPALATEHAVLNFDFNLNNRGLLPGDTVRYFVRAVDNAPQGHVGLSREFVLRLPTLSEVRAAAREASQEVGRSFDSLAADSRRLERSTEDLATERERPATDPNRSGNQSAMSYEASQRAEAVARSQEQMVERAEALKEALAELQRSAEAAGLNDPAWQQRLQEIREQLERALTPELKERLAALQQSLQDLDPERAKEALQRLAEAQQKLREALERSQELFKRAAMEGDMANLAAESDELAREQQQWSEQTEQANPERSSAEEQDLAARADSLATQLEKLASQMAEPDRKDRMDSAAAQASDAAQQMQQAAQSAGQQQRRQARQHGEQAAQKLQPLGQQLQQERASMQQEWRQEVTGAMDQAMAETSRLTERELALSESFRRGDASAGNRAEQGALEEGVQKLIEQMQQAAGKNALVSPQIGTSMEVARQQMQRAREAVSNGAPNTREAAEAAGEAVDALNAAAYQLVRNRGDVSNSASGSGLQEAMEQMQRMAAQQGGMNQEAASMLPMMGNAGIQQQLRQLAAQQRAMADQLERMRAQGNTPGAAELAQEARDLARRIEAGRLDRETVERQERLFRRMLDAGRTLQGQEKDENKERQSSTATGDSVHLPPALRSRLLDENNRIRMPDWESLQRLSPEERRLVIEYFQRLAGTGQGTER
ncbi:MAG TPA: hypothetical protein VGP80_06035 [Gemmatimonadales bacterium]|nr:hypothetical protein [Gemmatimonadales bacterium]